MTLKIIEFLAVFLLALVAGVFWGTWLSLTRTRESFSAEVFLAVGKRMIRNLAVPMRILTPGTALAILILCYSQFHDHYFHSFLLAMVSVVLVLVAIISTLVINVPIDNKLKHWTVDTLPHDWKKIWRRWSRFHTLRTLLAILSLIFLLASVLSR